MQDLMSCEQNKIVPSIFFEKNFNICNNRLHPSVKLCHFDVKLSSLVITKFKFYNKENLSET